MVDMIERILGEVVRDYLERARKRTRARKQFAKESGGALGMTHSEVTRVLFF